MNTWPKTGNHTALFRFLSIFGLVLLIIFQANSVFAAPADLVIEVFPSVLELGTGKTGQVQIVVSNPSNQLASNLKLSWINNTSLQISSKNKTIAELPPNAGTAWNLEIKQEDQALDFGKIYVRLDYTWRDSNSPESKSVSRIQFSEIQITIPVVESVSNVASVEVKSTLTTLNEQRAGPVYLILENKSDVPLHVKAINLSAPAFIKADLLDNIDDLVLYPHEKRNVPYQVQVSDVVQPDKYVLLFEIEITWKKGGQAHVGTLFASHELNVGVFGESEILTLLGIPAFFLLPGFLMIVAFRLLWMNDRSNKDWTKFPLATASSEFWFVAISLSLLMAVLYPLATNLLFGVGRNYLGAYNLIDVFYLWFGSILLAFLSYVSYYGSKALLIKYHEKILRGKTPTVEDRPIVTLQKLARQKLTMSRDRALITINGNEYWTFLLQAWTENQQTYWVAPLIWITNREELDDSLQSYLYKIIDTGTDIDEFIELSPKLTLVWENNWPEPGPYQVEKSNIRRLEMPQVMVEFN